PPMPLAADLGHRLAFFLRLPFQTAISGYLPFPPRSCLALPLALARAPHRGAPCLLRPVLGAGNTGVGSPRMRSTAGKRAETVPSLARAIAGGSSVRRLPLPLASAVGSSGGANHVRG